MSGMLSRLLAGTRGAAVLVALATLAACRAAPDATQAPAEQTQPAPTDSSGFPQARKVVIAFLGDSLTAGQGLPSLQSFPAKIEELFHTEGYNEIEVLNGGVSGDTSAGGRQRVEQLLVPDLPRIVVVALGANDALRGLSTTMTRDNLAAIIEILRARGIAVVLAGMLAPPNYGEDYQANFRALFAQLARDYRGQISYVPFLLEGVAGVPALNQPDGIHPNAEGAKIIAQHLYPTLRDIVDQSPQPAQ